MPAPTCTPQTDIAADALFSICASLIHPDGWKLPEGIGDHIEAVLAHAAVHGLEPLLYRCISSADGLNLPPEIISHLAQRYYGQAARNAVALHHLDEIAKAFAERGIPVIALKGAAAILWLYDDIACRVITDLDLLVPEGQIDAAAKAMEELGYANKPTNSPEAQRAALLDNLDRGEHISPFYRRASFAVEIHPNIIRGRENPHTIADEIWSRAVSLNPEMPNLMRLSTMDFLLHGVAHYAQHIALEVLPLKFLVDMALAVRRCSGEVDWNLFWATAHRWDLGRSAEVVMATVAHHFGVDVPGLPHDAPCLDADALLKGLPLSSRSMVAPTFRPRSSLRRVFGRYLKFVRRTRRLPSWDERLRYLFHLVFPAPAYIRERYKVPEGRCVVPYYLIHPFRPARNFVVCIARDLFRSRRDKTG